MKTKRCFSVIAISWSLFLAAIITFFFICFLKINKPLRDFAISNVKSELLYKANESVLSVIDSEKIDYSGITNISYNDSNEITGVSIDSAVADKLKAKISNAIYKSIPKEEIYTVNIPIGTLLFNQYIGGLGPKIPFNSQLSSGCKVDFESSFESVGINQTRHRIMLNVNLSGVVLFLGKHSCYSVKTKYILAETVIVGHSPQSFAEISDAGSPSNKIYKYVK